MSVASAIVDVWHVDLDAGLGTAADVLSLDEISRASRFVRELHRHRFMVGRAALRRILASRLAMEPAALRFSYGRWGKPALAAPRGAARLEFNLAHSEGVMLCAVAEARALGIDVERMRHDSDLLALAQRYFSSREQAMLAQLDPAERARGFIACWTRKEAYIKAIGMGLSAPLARFSVSLSPREPPELLEISDAPDAAGLWSMSSFDPAPGFVAALVVEGKDWSIAHRQWLAPSPLQGRDGCP